MSFFSISSLLLLTVASLNSMSSPVDAVGISQRISKHPLSPRRALMGPADCPWGSKRRINGVDSCCEVGVADPLCCPLNGEQCFCKEESHPHRKESNRGNSNGCGSKTSIWPMWIQNLFSLELNDACDSHDACYTNCEKTHEQCDREFYDAGVKLCLDTYWYEWNPLYQLCVGRMSIFVSFMEESTAWLESMIDSCYCSAHEHDLFTDFPIGCYQDRSDRQFDVNKGRLGSRSIREFNPERCWKECEGYRYYALQDGDDEHGAECWCGSSLKENKYAKRPFEECRNEKGFTGGQWRNLVFLRATHRG